MNEDSRGPKGIMTRGQNVYGGGSYSAKVGQGNLTNFARQKLAPAQANKLNLAKMAQEALNGY